MTEIVDEEGIRRLVHRFYGRVREDDLIGPIFTARIEDWDHHLAKLCDFWSSVILRTRRYEGRPMRAHLLLPMRIEAAHFDRWLELFEQTAREEFSPGAAELFLMRARQIADSFEMGIASQHGDIVAPRHSKRAS
jgi:hemoglobin